MDRIGIDFDNTLISYDEVFRKAAREKGCPITTGASSKTQLKKFLQSKKSGNLIWSRLQGEIYGERIPEAALSPGALEFIKAAITGGSTIHIISHKTSYASIGEPIDLHQKAKQFIAERILAKLPSGDQGSLHCHFCPTLDEKWRTIQAMNCCWFVDDLDWFLRDERFPKSTRRIHFRPPNRPPSEFELETNDWAGMLKFIQEATKASPSPKNRQTDRTASAPDNPFELFRKLLKQGGLGNLKTLSELTGGINNWVYKLESHSGRSFCGKIYRRAENDPRDRMGHEVAFLRFAEANAIDCLPQILLESPAEGAIVMNYIDGSLWPEDQEVPAHFWNQCLDFYGQIQKSRDSRFAQALPRAAEGAKCMQEHLGWLQTRRDFWRRQALDGKLDKDTCSLVLDELETAYQYCAEKAISHPEFQTEFPEANRIISPSDFGLHNALVDGDQKLWFIDFEYAGWDDICKASIDFRTQPRYPVPNEINLPSNRIETTLLTCIEDILQLKWKYIILNKNTQSALA